MIAPKWVNTHIQPIYVTDVLAYLTQAINVEAPHHLVVGIGGKDIITFKELMLKYAQLRSLKRTVIVVPFLTPYLSSLWLGLVTPIYARIGRKLIESIYNETVVVDKTNLKYFTVSPLGYKEALKKCLEEEKKEEKTFSWTDAQSSIGLLPKKNQSTHKKEDEYHIKIKASLEQVFAVIERFWQTLSPRWIRFLWFIRASIDLVIGGVGLKRQRRSYKSLRVGDVFGVWRVVSLEKNKAIMLKAEMKLPGDAYLHIELEPLEKDVLLRQKLVFYPRGFWGLCYWYIVYPFHFLIFQSECKKIKEFSEKL